MAKKHFDEYVLKLEAQLKQFKDNEQQLIKEAQEGLTDIDFVENYKKMVAPFETNYKRVLSLKILLDQPVRKSKVPAYKRRLQKAIKYIGEHNSTDGVLEENKNILEQVSTMKK